MNIYDASGTEGDSQDEIDDDDMDFEPTTDESEDNEYFDPSEDPEAEFHGKRVFIRMSLLKNGQRVVKSGLLSLQSLNLSHLSSRRRG